jgi:hypothetical protein
VDRLLCILDFAHIKLSDIRDGIVLVNNCRGFSLSLGKNDIHKLLGRWDDLDGLEVVKRHCYLKILLYNGLLRSRVGSAKNERTKIAQPADKKILFNVSSLFIIYLSILNTANMVLGLFTPSIFTGIVSFALLVIASWCVGEGGEILGKKYDASIIGGLVIAWLNTGKI